MRWEKERVAALLHLDPILSVQYQGFVQNFPPSCAEGPTQAVVSEAVALNLEKKTFELFSLPAIRIQAMKQKGQHSLFVAASAWLHRMAPEGIWYDVPRTVWNLEKQCSLMLLILVSETLQAFVISDSDGLYSNTCDRQSRRQTRH